MRYPWVALSIFSVWIVSLAIILAHVGSADTIYLYATITSLMLFLLGFVRR